MLLSLLKTVVQNVFPHVCLYCKHYAISKNQILCASCLHNLPFTYQEKVVDNEVERIFWGRVLLHKAFALTYFNKGNIVQHVMHKLKYRNEIEVGILFGKLIGERIKQYWHNTHIDFIVPVPLFVTKEYKRGYNQAYVIAKGIAEVINIPISKNNLCRIKKGNSQTQLSRMERWHMVENMFAIKNAALFVDKHILLVDDTLTTGATLEACAMPFLQVKGITISIAAAAYVSNQ